MLTVAEALRRVLDAAWPLPPCRSRSLIEALGATLYNDVPADRDSPPFDKALVDGFALRSSDLAEPGPVRLLVVDEITAGRIADRALGPGECASIMTGAPLPSGADAVIMHEVVERPAVGAIVVQGPVATGTNRLERGREMRAGEVILRAGETINAAQLGVLATVGRVEVDVFQRPRVAILPTGDELVRSDQEPGPGQIRNSNASTLGALIRSAGYECREFPIARDHPDALRRSLMSIFGCHESDGNRFAGFQPQALLVCGGVSAGKLDLVPAALEDFGVRPIFHKVRVRPGKPLWFGVGPPTEEPWPPPLVFGLPGNPVSGLVSTLLFVLPALAAMSGRPAEGPRMERWPLATPFRHRGDRETYHPARIVGEPGSRRVEPLPWAGSPDLLTVARADGFVAVPAGDRDYESGEPVAFLPLLPPSRSSCP